MSYFQLYSSPSRLSRTIIFVMQSSGQKSKYFSIENMGLETELSPLEWNFDAVPDKELVACCFWEYARESAFIRGVRQRCLKNRRSGGHLDQQLYTDLDKLQSISYASEVFIRGFFFEPNITYQSVDKGLPNYRHPDAPPISGSFPAPWQSLSLNERTFRAHIRTDVEQLQIVPIKLSHWSWAKEIARGCQYIADDQHERQKTWERKYLRENKNGNSFVAADGLAPPNFEPIRPRTRWGVGETLMVDIAWDYFTNDEIATYFRQWVKHARPEKMYAPSGQGHKPKDLRANLTRLAVMRLLSQFFPFQIFSQNSFPAIWDAKQFSGRKWEDVTKWHDARREAGKLFRNLFPFLPLEEKPISWERQTRRK
jgi:hypothetical protein